MREQVAEEPLAGLLLVEHAHRVFVDDEPGPRHPFRRLVRHGFRFRIAFLDARGDADEFQIGYPLGHGPVRQTYDDLLSPAIELGQPIVVPVQVAADTARRQDNDGSTPRDHWDQPLRTLRLRDGAAGSRWFHRGPGHGIQSAHVMLLFHVSASRTMVASCVACSGRFPHIPGIHPILALAPASITPRYASPGKPTDGRLTSSRC